MEKAEILEAVKSTVVESFNEVMEKSLSNMEDISKKVARQVVEGMLVERAVKGTDITGLTDEQKKDFSLQVIEAYKGHETKAVRVAKANEPMIEEQDNRGGYLIQPEVAAAILRIAASVGTIMKQAQKWPMKSDTLGIPNYTGAFLTGAYVGVDIAGPITGLTFGQAVLIRRKWQLAFTIGNDLLADASVQLGDWLIAMAGEALANMVDQQGFIGGSATAPGPFVGVMNVPGTNVYTMKAGNSQTTYSSFNPVTDALAVIATVEESVLDGCKWYMHRTVWAGIAATLASTSGIPLLFLGALPANHSGLEKDPLGGPIRAAGNMQGFDVITNRWLPATTDSTATQLGNAFMVFGNLKAMAFGDNGDIRVGNFQSGTWGGKELSLSDQSGIVYKHGHAIVVVLPKAFTVVKTALT